MPAQLRHIGMGGVTREPGRGLLRTEPGVTISGALLLQ
jgi:hypothetical protein